jgi:peptidyl-prolyl cis-trans isomerase C
MNPMQLSELSSKIMVAILLLGIPACAHSPKVAAELSPVASATDKTVARVNGKDISDSELQRAKKILLANKPGLLIPPLLQKEFDTQALNQMISTELLFQASQKLEAKDLDKEAAAKLGQIKSGFRDPKDYDRQLRSIGMDEKMLLDSSRHDLAIAYFVNTQIAPQVNVTEEEVKTFYDHNPEKFRQDEQVRASHILVGIDSKAGLEEKKAAREKADRLHADLVNGADFAKLARESSTCPSGKQGGDLGYFSKGKMVPQFEQAAFALEPGGLSDVVETLFGYHVIKLVDRKKAEGIPLDAAKDAIEKYLRAQKTNEAIEVYLAQARKSSKIELF